MEVRKQLVDKREFLEPGEMEVMEVETRRVAEEEDGMVVLDRRVLLQEVEARGMF